MYLVQNKNKIHIAFKFNESYYCLCGIVQKNYKVNYKTEPKNIIAIDNYTNASCSVCVEIRNTCGDSEFLHKKNKTTFNMLDLIQYKKDLSYSEQYKYWKMDKFKR